MAGGSKWSYVPIGGLETTPGIFVGLTILVIVGISLLIEWLIHKTEHSIEHKKRKELLKAFDKLKEELLLLGFISLLMTLFEESVLGICVPTHKILRELSPCDQDLRDDAGVLGGTHSRRSLLAAAPKECPAGKSPFIAQKALHQIHLFIFILAVTHVAYSCFAMFLAITKVNQWRKWELMARHELAVAQGNASPGFAPDVKIEVQHLKGRGSASFLNRHQSVAARWGLPAWLQRILEWVGCFFRQFFSTVRQSDYMAMRTAFVSFHNLKPDFDFHKYVKRCLEDDFSKIVGINWAMWLVVVAYMSLDLPYSRWVYWFPNIAIVLILATGAKLVRTIQVLSRDIDAMDLHETGARMRPRDTLFWFNRPQLVSSLIYFLLFQNSLQISLFLFYLWQSGIDSCYLDTRTVTIGMAIVAFLMVFLIAYLTLPTYSLVSQMGSSYSGAIFGDQVRKALKKWTRQAKKTLKTAKHHEGEAVHLPEGEDLYGGGASSSGHGVEMGRAGGSSQPPPPPYPGF